MEDKVYEVLDNLKINYKKVSHEPLYRVEEAKKTKIDLEGIGCKTLFLKDKSQRFYLYVLNGEKRANLKEIAEKIETSRLSFGSEEELYLKTKLVPGSVTPFGILNNNGDITVLLDSELVDNYVIVHPNINTSSISIKCEDLIKIVELYNNRYMIV